MKNSDRFMAAFNSIESLLSTRLNRNQYISFFKLVDECSKFHADIRTFKNNLRMLGNLRNAIVHQRVDRIEIIAEPHDSTVELIEKIEREIKEPIKVLPTFSRAVTTFEYSNSLMDVLRVIKQSSFSQFPIYHNGKFKGLLTENGITAYIAHIVEQEIIDFNDTRLDDVVSLEESKNNFQFISRDTSLYEAKEYFKNSIGSFETVKLDALLITHNGKKEEKLLGIVTAWDVVNLP